MLYQKAQGSYQFNTLILNDWADLLLAVLNEFIEAYNGLVHEDFWQRICSNSIRVSADQGNLKGWFPVFPAFPRSWRISFEFSARCVENPYLWCCQ